MKTHNCYFLTPTVLFLLFLFSCSAAAAQDLLRSSCIHAKYPTLCVQTLSTYATPSTTPLDLAQAAVRVSLAHARALSAYLSTLNSQLQQAPPSVGSIKRQRAAVSDCTVQMSDSVDQLTRTLTELRHMQVGTASFQWHMSNAQTWTSTALTDGVSCIDGFNGDSGGGKVSLDVKSRVTGVGMLTSNALYLITLIGVDNNSVGGKPRSNSKN